MPPKATAASKKATIAKKAAVRGRPKQRQPTQSSPNATIIAYRSPSFSPRRVPAANNQRPIIARFSKEKDGIRVQAWVNLFELIVTGISDQQKIITLIRYVDGEALTWVGDEIAPHASTLTWKEVRDRMIKRFGRISIHPHIAAQRRTYKYGESVQTYYESKMDLLRQANMDQDAQIASLTDGMPDSYQNLLNACDLSSPSDWLSKALKFEVTFTKKRSYHPIQQPVAAAAVAQAKVNEARKPSQPCRFCKEAKGKDLFHWHNECRLNLANQQQSRSAARTSSSRASHNQAADSHVSSAADALAANQEN